MNFWFKLYNSNLPCRSFVWGRDSFKRRESSSQSPLHRRPHGSCKRPCLQGHDLAINIFSEVHLWLDGSADGGWTICGFDSTYNLPCGLSKPFLHMGSVSNTHMLRRSFCRRPSTGITQRWVKSRNSLSVKLKQVALSQLSKGGWMCSVQLAESLLPWVETC